MLDLLPSIGFIVFGGILFWQGLRLRRQKRVMDEIPLAKVGSAALGVVEMTGTARPGSDTVAPLSGRFCCWWECTLEVSDRDGWVANRRWSSGPDFRLEDNTGSVTINPRKADIEVGGTTYPLADIDKPVVRAVLSQTGAVPKSVDYVNKLSMVRLVERVIDDGAVLFAVGTLGIRRQGDSEQRVLESRENQPLRLAQRKNEVEGEVGYQWMTYVFLGCLVFAVGLYTLLRGSWQLG